MRYSRAEPAHEQGEAQEPRPSSDRSAAWVRVPQLSNAALVVPGRSQAAGEIYWFQLQTEDAVAAIRFYSGLFGWEIDTGRLFLALPPLYRLSHGGKSAYARDDAHRDELLAGEFKGKKPEISRFKGLGERSHRRHEIKGWGQFAILQDPDGAPLIIAQPQRPLGGTMGYGWRWAEL
jgi:hypothetical protein